MSLAPRVVVVTRPSEFDELIARHGTVGAVAFFLSTRDRSIDDVRQRHDRLDEAVATVTAAIPDDWRRGRVDRADLDRFVFASEDIVVAVGQDGLVANIAKYLDGQPVIGINPEPDRNPGVLVAHPPQATAVLLAAAASPATADLVGRTMVQVTTDDGQHLSALNELYVGHASHQSARYRIALPDGRTERQSSSGILAGTGTGATGWLCSAARERHSGLALPTAGDERLCWFVREAWPSPATGTELTEGIIGGGERLSIAAESDELVVFGDGIEHDALRLTWGQRADIAVAPHRLRLVE